MTDSTPESRPEPLDIRPATYDRVDRVEPGANTETRPSTNGETR